MTKPPDSGPRSLRDLIRAARADLDALEKADLCFPANFSCKAANRSDQNVLLFNSERHLIRGNSTTDLARLFVAAAQHASPPADGLEAALRTRTKQLNGKRAPEDPFVSRVRRVVEVWVAREWNDMMRHIEAAKRHGGGPAYDSDLRAAKLTTDNLAYRLDRMSVRSLRRELKRLGAPSPGDIIRTARIDYARQLLATTRMKVTEIARRAGYGNIGHFTKQFVRETGLTPMRYRRGVAEPVDQTQERGSVSGEEA